MGLTRFDPDLGRLPTPLASPGVRSRARSSTQFSDLSRWLARAAHCPSRSAMSAKLSCCWPHGRRRVVSSERLVDAIWGDEPPRSSTKVVQNLVMRFERCWDRTAIETRPTGYVLRGSDAVDSRRFERLIAEGRNAAEDGEWEASARALAAALSLWRGDPLVDLGMWAPGRWERARLDEQYRCTAEELAEAELARGKHRERLAFLHNLVSEEPLRERGWALLMVALFRCAATGRSTRRVSTRSNVTR